MTIFHLPHTSTTAKLMAVAAPSNVTAASVIDAVIPSARRRRDE